ncbi:MAG: nickel pincer cofactor biosynthesis protein LarC [Candidatus Bathyarchaeia archaeon]
MLEKDRILIVDCQVAGISGDMFLGALIDLGADVAKITSAIKTLENPHIYENVKVDIQKVTKKGFRATKFDVTAENANIKTGNLLIKLVEETTKDIKLSNDARRFASQTIRTLVNAETKIHGNDDKLHMHEIGSVDTAAEIIGAAVALDDLNLFKAKVFATPVSVGGGLFKFSHGIVTSPAPATIEILAAKNFPIRGGPVEAELTTPTGAAILVNLACDTMCFYPEMRLTKVGYGAGNRDFEEMPNLLRLILGMSTENQLIKEEIAVLETNVDDVTGEVVGHAIDKLLSAGAKDVSIIPIFTKKSRPGQILKIIVDPCDVVRLAELVVEETGTLGVRVYPCSRFILNREQILVEVPINKDRRTIRVKIAKNKNGKIIQIKPEYDEAKRLSDETGIPIREIQEIARAKARDALLKGATDESA